MIRLQSLTKYFGGVRAVNELSLEVSGGSVLGLIGPNGAGKTTTLRMLATLLRPDGGTATVNGLDVVADHREVRACLGYMPDAFGVYDQITVWEYLDFYACAHAVSYARRAPLVRDMLELVDLSAKREANVNTLSRGMKQRLCLATALLHDPQVLLLDEPASGVDPRSRFEMRQLLQELQQLGKTIVVSSHILSELAEICSHVAILEQGRLVTAGPVSELTGLQAGARRLTVQLGAYQQEAAQFLLTCPKVENAQVVEDGVIVLYRGDGQDQQALLALLVERRFPVRSFAEEEISLEDLYMHVIRDVEEAEQ